MTGLHSDAGFSATAYVETVKMMMAVKNTVDNLSYLISFLCFCHIVKTNWISDRVNSTFKTLFCVLFVLNIVKSTNINRCFAVKTQAVFSTHKVVVQKSILGGKMVHCTVTMLVSFFLSMQNLRVLEGPTSKSSQLVKLSIVCYTERGNVTGRLILLDT